MKEKLAVFILFLSFAMLAPYIFNQAVYADDFTVLHEFAGVAGDDGSNPFGSLVRGENTLYGMTYQGGNPNNGGVIFSICTDGTGFNVLHEFAGGEGDGRYPWDSLILDEDILYGMTSQGGDPFNQGVIFSIGTDGNDFTVLHEFTGGGDGGSPRGSLIQDGDILYGMTAVGGVWARGVIFSIEKDGDNFSVIHDFTGDGNGGQWPYGSLIQDGDTLYGMTLADGGGNKGVVFSIGTDGAGLALLHEFASGDDDGGSPEGSLIKDGDTLYGMSVLGGDDDEGIIFSIKTNGTGFTILHEFAGGVDDGGTPRDSFIQRGDILYGTAYWDGDNNQGVIFSIRTDGSDFTLLHEFTAPSGGNPHGNLILDEDGETFYGLTQKGGSNDQGVIFSFFCPPPPEEEEDGNGDNGDDGDDDDWVRTPHCFLQPIFSGISAATTNELMVLRRFRDKNLLTNPVGTVFVTAYYKISPPMAEFIRQYPTLKSAVREILKPVVWLCEGINE